MSKLMAKTSRKTLAYRGKAGASVKSGVDARGDPNGLMRALHGGPGEPRVRTIIGRPPRVLMAIDSHEWTE